MNTNLRLLFAISIFFVGFCGYGQKAYWQEASISSSKVSISLEKLSVKKAKIFKLEEEKLSQKLQVISSSKKTDILYFPDEQGKLVAFKVQESSVFSPELALKYPEIKSFKGVALNDASKNIRFSSSPNGIETMLVDSYSANATFMQKSADGDYVLYTRKTSDAVDTDFECETIDAIQSTIAAPQPSLVDTQILKKFRVAISATGEYTQYHGGTVAGALAAINATITRINMVYETDLGITLELVANTDLVIYTDASTDPYNGNLNTQTQNIFNTVIGAANYDVGHLLHKASNSGDAGFVGAICDDTKKGSGYSSGVNPQGDLFDIDFVAHEMGHQFGANHTWSFESEGTDVQAEPGSGSTIMGYAGISGVNNVAANGQDYFHYYSIKQITEFLATTSCATEISLLNNPPTVSLLQNYTIPIGTAFVLTGNATDADPTDVLTYTWEQIDNGVVTNTSFGPDNPSGANFRSYKPTTNPTRYFPQLSSILQGNLTQTNPTVNSTWETVSNVAREMNFAFTVRDNNPEGGQVTSDILKIDVVNSAGPFTVLSQNSTTSYVGGSVQEIIWDVANTNNAIVNAQKVDILFSLDGGNTFPITVASEVLNDGSQNVVIPGEITNQARVMVKASDNIFFAVNSANFAITNAPIVLNFSSLDYDVCQPSNLVVPFIYETSAGFVETSNFSVSGLPAGLSASFSQPNANADNTAVSITFSNTNTVATGEYPITITATSATATKAIDINLNINNTTFSPVNLISPASNETDVSSNQSFIWGAQTNSTAYDIQIATDSAFTDIIESTTVLFNNYTSLGLLPSTTYYWRIKPKNNCGEGVFGTANSFTTIQVDCELKTGENFPIIIPSVGTSTRYSTITFVEDLPIADVNVVLNVTHTYLADLTIKLTSPTGTTVVLVSSSCGDNQNINATFDADGSSFVCGVNPGITGIVKPLGSLDSFIGESSQGDWILEIKDNAGGDGGSLNNFAIDLCIEGQFRPDADEDGVFDDGEDLCLGTPIGQEVNVNGCPVYRFSNTHFTIKSASESCRNNDDGSLQITAATGLNYTATLTTSGNSVTSSFTNTHTFNDLPAGNYSVCITGTNGVIIYEDYCFDVIISQPDELLVSSNLTTDKNGVLLNLSGAESYTITLNGVSTVVNSNSVTIPLKNGINTLKVATDLPCQGVYEETILVSDKPFLYPNPSENNANIFVGEQQLNCAIWIYAMNGKLVKEFHYQDTDVEIELEVSDLPQGMYIVKLKSENLEETFKLIKK